MNFLIDNQLPQALAAFFRGRGHQCAHVLDLGLDEAGDVELWERASRLGQILVSKDEDFVFLAHRPGDVGQLVWVRLGNCRNPSLLAAFDRLHDQLLLALQSSQRIVEVR
jgi:predicted nuclease of predicted toxin-antitoxin system